VNYWHTTHLADVTVTPWRNGSGLTRELAAWPDAADWQWRMSVAEVANSGPFSCFDGVMRWFAVLSGEGVVLQIRPAGAPADTPCQEHRLTASSPPLRFNGADATHCQLIQGGTQDFNLMLRANGQSAQMQRVQGSLTANLSPNTTIAVYALAAGTAIELSQEGEGSEPHIIPPQTLVWQTLRRAATVQLNTRHALWMELTP
jgi:environmental stress-induced protein Ves